MESVISGSIVLLEGLLHKFGELSVGSGFGVKETECGFEILGEFVEGFLTVGNQGVSHLVTPDLGIECSSSAAPFVQGGHDFGGISGVKGRVQSEVGLHGLVPLGSIIIFARKISWECSLQF